MAIKLVANEALPLTPKPSVIERYMTKLLTLFTVQACVILGVHLASANLASGLFAPEDGEDYSCEPEFVLHYCSATVSILFTQSYPVGSYKLQVISTLCPTLITHMHTHKDLCTSRF